MRRSTTLSVSLSAPFDRVWDFIADPRNLHLWTVDFALESPTPRGRTFDVKTPRGTLELSVQADKSSGVLDFHFGAAGRTSVAPSRLLRNDEGCIYIFTQLEPQDAPPELFDRLVDNVKDELEILARRFGPAPESH